MSPMTPTPRWPIVLFDLDGTLLDSASGISRCLRLALASHGIEESEYDLRRLIGIPLAKIFQGFGLDETSVAECVATYRSAYAAGGRDEAAVYEGASETVDRLRASGVRLAVATAKETLSASIMVRQHFGDAFETVVGDTIDNRRWHKEDVIAEALLQLGATPADAVMIGDRDLDIEGARAKGLPAIGVAWGHGTKQEHEAAAATHSVATWNELRALLLPEG